MNEDNKPEIADKGNGKVNKPASKEDTKNYAVPGNFFIHLFRKIRRKEYQPFSKGLNGLLEEKKAFDETRKAELEKYNTYEAIMSISKSSREYYFLLMISCLIALFGLYQNSAATIIGAMIVAPLMGPIMGFSAGVLWGKFKDISSSVFTLLKGIAIVLAITAVLSYLLSHTSITPEIMNRTNPSVYDIVIAILCGLIGAYGIVNKKVSATLTGVAISVALMPPLCTAGIGIGLMNAKIAGGAALLFFINLLGISLGSIVVFYLVRLHPSGPDESFKLEIKRRALYQIVISLVLIGVIFAALSYFTYSTYDNVRDKNAAKAVLQKYFHENELFSVESVTGKDILAVRAVILGEIRLSASKNEIAHEIEGRTGKKVLLNLFSIHEFPGE